MIPLSLRLFLSDLFIDADGAHQDDDESEKTCQPPGPAHILFDYYQHDDGYEENGGDLIPYPQTLGWPFENAFHLLGVDRLE